MIYFGQEVGESAALAEGFSGADGRTSIFDYCGVPEHQKWLNNGRFDGGGLSEDQKQLRNFYSTLLNAVADNEALSTGAFYELQFANQNRGNFDERIYCFLRYTDAQQILVMANFDRNPRQLNVLLPDDLLDKVNLSGAKTLTDLLSDKVYHTADIRHGIDIELPPGGGVLLSFS